MRNGAACLDRFGHPCGREETSPLIEKLNPTGQRCCMISGNARAIPTVSIWLLGVSS